MCDDDSLDDMLQYDLRARAEREARLSRRGFATALGATGLVALLPGCQPDAASSKGPPATPVGTDSNASAPSTGNAGTSDLHESEVVIKTPDGECDAHFVHPGTGAHPAVLVWPDVFGLRDSFREMGRRLARSGYAVLTVNPFYRQQKAPTSAPHANFEDPAVRQVLTALMQSLTPETEVTDAKTLTAWLDAQPAVDKSKKMATTGYCMGGPIVFRTAATASDRIGAAATFHGGGLVTDKPNSPHLLVPQMKAHVLLAIASNDDAKQPDAKTTLREAFAKQSLPAEIEVYPALHGWCPPDSHSYDHDAAEKAWSRQLALFTSTLV